MLRKTVIGAGVAALAAASSAAEQPAVAVTEWMYAGGTPSGGEFIELTNLSDVPVDMTGWSFDDSNREPGAFDLGEFGTIAPGESVIITEDDAGDFRSAWDLDGSVKVIGHLGAVSGSNLGRNDEINLFDSSGVLVDRLTYGDEDFPGSIRTRWFSGNPLVAGALGANDVYQWSLAALGDSQESWANTAGDVGSPGLFIMPSGEAVPGPVVVSQPSGFFSEPLTVHLEVEEGFSIRYTLDGSLPTQSSPLYSGPVLIADRSSDPNYYSLIQSAPDESWQVPAGNIFKATAFRAAAFNGEGISGPVTTRTYIVHPLGPSRFTMPVISIVTDEPEFFDYTRGIYVPGLIYDKFYDPDVQPWNRPGNYSQRGDAWERPAKFEFFEPDGSPGPSLDVGVRIHGGASRANRRKSLRVYARSEYGQSWIEYPMFPGEATQQFKRLILRNGGNDSGRTLFRDAFIQDLVKDTGVGTQWHRPSIVLLNGEYWGVHTIRQRYDKYFLQAMYGADPDNVDLISGPSAEAEEGDNTQFLQDANYIISHDMSDPAHFDQASALIDMDNFITYTAIELFIANTDWPQNNIEMWRERVPGSRWKWLLYDTDLAFNATASQAPTFDAVSRILGHASRHSRMVQSLMDNPGFRTAFLSRSADLMNKELSAQNMLARLDDFQTVYAPEMAEHIHRWRSPTSLSQWENTHIGRMRAFIQDRADLHRGHLATAFGLPGTASLTVHTPRPHAGTVQVNTIRLPEDGSSWAGVYFQGVPVTLTGEAASGYRFLGFEELPDVPTDGVIVWMPEGSQTLTARFVCNADLDGDGSLTVFDVSAFVTSFAAMDPAADLAVPFGVFDIFDLIAFIEAYSAGCP